MAHVPVVLVVPVVPVVPVVSVVPIVPDVSVYLVICQSDALDGSIEEAIYGIKRKPKHDATVPKTPKKPPTMNARERTLTIVRVPPRLLL